MKEIPAVINEILSPRRLRAFLRKNRLRVRRGLGQNFLINRNILEKIIAAAELSAGERVVEVGPGLGFLSAFLLRAGVRLDAFERDRALVAHLENTFDADPDFSLNIGDVLKADLEAILKEDQFKLVSNLPYNITSPVFSRFLPRIGLKTMVVTVQRQAGERIVSPPACNSYGAFSLFCQFYADTELLFHVSPGSFHPAPAVHSSVVRLNTKQPPLKGAGSTMFFALVRAVFNSRRKTLRNNLKLGKLPGLQQEAVLDLLQCSGVDPEIRGEKLSLEEFCSLAAHFTAGAKTDWNLP